MAETTNETTRYSSSSRTRSISAAEAADATLARTSGTPFWLMAILLVFGVAVACLMALEGLRGPGLFTPEQADVAVGLTLFAIAIILFVFLGTIGYVFGEVRRLRTIGETRETRRLEEATRQEGVNRSLRDEVTALRQREHLLVSQLADRRRIASGAHDGDPHVITIEGIGPHYALRLNEIGIITVNQLVAADADDVARRIEATPEQVREWQAMGRLMAIPGVGPQWAEALARVGFQGREDLAKADATQVAEAIARLNSGQVRVTGRDPSPATVRRWIRAAAGLPVVSRRARRPAASGSHHTARRGNRTKVRPRMR